MTEENYAQITIHSFSSWEVDLGVHSTQLFLLPTCLHKLPANESISSSMCLILKCKFISFSQLLEDKRSLYIGVAAFSRIRAIFQLFLCPDKTTELSLANSDGTHGERIEKKHVQKIWTNDIVADFHLPFSWTSLCHASYSMCTARIADKCHSFCNCPSFWP